MAEDPHLMLYLRFRPGRFGELRGQPHVVRALQSAVRSGHVAHAYLFSGERGTGKTSTARILARALNCAEPVDGEPCGSCPSCVEIASGKSVNVLELDAASNNGVDAMRDLIAHAALASPGRWKVYIIDEVHMLSNAAASALLKTLEEPPSHVIFVLATTEPHKVLPTIRSRTQHLEFRLLSADTLSSLLNDVNAAAGLSLDDRTLARAVHDGRGSARDALSALERVAASGPAEDEGPELAEVVEALTDEDAGRALVAIGALHEKGIGPQQLAAGLVDELRQAFLVALAPELADAGDADRSRLSDQADRLGLARLVRAMEVLGRAMVDMRDAPDARVVLEVALVRLARSELDDSTAAILDRLSRVERASAARAGAVQGGGAAPTRAQGAESGPPSGATLDPRTRPSVGALLRQRAASGSDSGSDSVLASAPAASAPAASAPAASDLVPASPDGLPEETPVGAPDRDQLVQAWGDHILRALPARPKALYMGGRFVSTDHGSVVFSLPNEPHRVRCEEVRHVVEQALEAHFGVPIHLELEVDGPAPGQSSGQIPGQATGSARRTGTASARGRGAGGALGERDVRARRAGSTDVSEDPETEDLDEVAVGTEGVEDIASVAEARVLDAFPGAEEVPG